MNNYQKVLNFICYWLFHHLGHIFTYYESVSDNTGLLIEGRFNEKVESVCDNTCLLEVLSLKL